MRKLIRVFMSMLCVIAIICGSLFTIRTGNEETVNMFNEIVVNGYEVEPTSITVSPTEINIIAGKTAQLSATVSPASAIQSVTWNSNNTETVTVDQNGKISGKNVGTAVITATTSNGLSAECAIRVLFSDVFDESKYYYNPVYWAVDNEITVGAGGYGKFSPNAPCTREQIVTFLWRLMDKPEPMMACSFTDVPESAWYYNSIAWAYENGITTGLNDGTGRFGVGQPCTREQCVTFLYRAADVDGVDMHETFVDVAEGKYYYDAISWAASKGITTGLNDGTGRFGVGQKCTRAMIVAFLYRYDQTILESVLSDFASDNTVALANEDTIVTFTVLSKDLTLPISLYANSDEYIDEMFDDGTHGDVLEGDGIYTYQTLLNFVAGTVKFCAKSGDLVSNSVSIDFYDMPTEEMKTDAEDIQAQLDSIVLDFCEEDGGISSDDLSAVLNRAADYAEELMRDGKLNSYEVTETSVVLHLISGLTIIFSPRITGTYNTGDDGTITIYTFQPLYDWVHNLTSTYISLPDGVDNEAILLSSAATALSNEFNNCNYTSETATRNQSISFSQIKNLGANQIVLWQGHGDWGGDKIHSVLLTNNQFDWNAWFWDPIYFIDCCADRIVNTNGYESVSSKYIDRYCNNLSNTYIYLGPCESGHDSVLAKSFLNKGATAVIGNTHSVLCLYGDVMEYTTTKLLSEINPSTDKYYSLGEALAKAKYLYGKDDSRYKNALGLLGPGAEPTLFGGAKAYNYRLGDMKKGSLSGKVCKASDRTTPISGAEIGVYKNGTIFKTLYSDNNGNYSAEMPVGDYLINISSDGYIAFDAYATVIHNLNTYMEAFLMVEGDESSFGDASGTIRNALSGYGISDVYLSIRKGWNNSFGEVIATTYTNENGAYSVTLPLGNYSVCAEKEGFISVLFNIIVQNGSTTEQNGTMTPVLEGDAFRITLSWGENPSDLDSHTVGTLTSGESFHVYYGNKSVYDGDIEVCNLDVDDTSSYGPETTTLVTTTASPYYYYIHRYAGSGTVSTSGAAVKVYQGDKIVATFNVPTDQGGGDYWNVFAVVNNQIIPKNTITDSADVSYAHGGNNSKELSEVISKQVSK